MRIIGLLIVLGAVMGLVYYLGEDMGFISAGEGEKVRIEAMQSTTKAVDTINRAGDDLQRRIDESTR